jgi:adenylate cyclase
VGARRIARLRRTLFLGVGAAMALVALLAWATDATGPLERSSVDARFALRGPSTPPRDVVVVQIDDKTFDDLDERWPFRRSLHGKLIDRLRRDGARTIAYDVQFTEQSDSEAEDNALIEAVARAHGRIVLATTEVDEKGNSGIFGGEDVLREIGARSGHAGIRPDPGGVFRRFPRRLEGLDSFAVSAARVATGRPVTAAAFPQDPAWIDFAGRPGAVRTVSFSDVLRGRVAPAVLRGKIVVVGAAAPSLQDVHATSTSGAELMSGPELQASAIATVLRGFPLRSVPRWVDAALIVLLALLAPLASLVTGPRRALLGAVVAGLAFAGGAQLAFGHGLIVAFVYPLGALVLGAVGALAVHYVTAAFERERTRAIFARFVPEQVVGEALECADDDLRLGGVRRDATVLFSDLRGFTTFAEERDPEVVIAILNRYLGAMSDAIMAHGGTLVAYMGDGIMAVFGAPLRQADHADRALAAAREMLEERLPAFNDWLVAAGHTPERFRMGVGLNSGPVHSGNVGSEQRMEYTAIGDTTNTAARLEGMTKGTPHQLFLAASTRAMLTRPTGGLELVGELDVRGRQGCIEVWTTAAADVDSDIETETAAAG